MEVWNLKDPGGIWYLGRYQSPEDANDMWDEEHDISIRDPNVALATVVAEAEATAVQAG